MLINNVGVNNNLEIISNGKKTTVNAVDIPEISSTTKSIFKDLGVASTINSSYPLKAKVETLSNSIQKLQDAKDHETKNKIFAILRSALTVALVVGAFLGANALAPCIPVFLGFFMLTFSAYTLLCYYNADRVVDLSEFLEAAALVAWLGGPFFPLYEVFTGVLPKLEGQVVAQKKEIETNMENLNSFFNLLDHNELDLKLNQEVEKLKEALKKLNELPLKTREGEKEIKEKIQQYERALEELKKAKTFYSQFQLS